MAYSQVTSFFCSWKWGIKSCPHTKQWNYTQEWTSGDGFHWRASVRSPSITPWAPSLRPQACCCLFTYESQLNPLPHAFLFLLLSQGPAAIPHLLCTVTLILPDSSPHLLKGCFTFDLYAVLSFDKWVRISSKLDSQFFNLLSLDPVG